MTGVVAFIELLIADGVPIDAALTAGRRYEEALAASLMGRRAKDAERQRRHREKRDNNAMSRDKRDERDTPSLPPLSPTPPFTTNLSPPPPIVPPSQPKPNGFARFWEAYPEKVGKRAAEAAYHKALKRLGGHDPAGVILAGVQRAMSSRKWREGIVPNPATWLNQDRWEDDPGSQAAQATGPPEPVTEAEQRRRLRHFRDTGEWGPTWGTRPEEIAA